MLDSGHKLSTPQKNRVFKYTNIFTVPIETPPVRTTGDGPTIGAIC
jgi:hypothetical protein